MKMFFGRIFASMVAMAVAAPANAGLLIDMSPDATGLTETFTGSNVADNQNFLMKITLATATTLNGIDIYSGCRNAGCGAPNIGTGAVVKIRSDVAGVPDNANLFTFKTLISQIDSVGSTANYYVERVHADFGDTLLSAGDYWIGLSGDNIEIGQEISFSPSPYPLFYILGGDSVYGTLSSSASTAFRIYGDNGAVPEPATWAMMLVGFGAVGFAMRGRQKIAVSFA